MARDLFVNNPKNIEFYLLDEMKKNKEEENIFKRAINRIQTRNLPAFGGKLSFQRLGSGSNLKNPVGDIKDKPPSINQIQPILNIKEVTEEEVEF